MRHTLIASRPAAIPNRRRVEEVIGLTPELAELIVSVVRLGFVIGLVVLVGLGL